MEEHRNWEQMEKNMDFAKRFAKWLGFTQRKLARKLGIYQADVSSVFNLRPRNKKHVQKILDFLGLTIEGNRLFYQRKVYFLVAEPASFLVSWSELYSNVLWHALRNYHRFSAELYLIFTEKSVPYGLLCLNPATEGSERVFFCIKNRLRLRLDAFLIEHFCTHPMGLLYESLKKEGASFKKRVIYFNEEYLKRLDTVFQKKQEEVIPQLFDAMRKIDFFVVDFWGVQEKVENISIFPFLTGTE